MKIDENIYENRFITQSSTSFETVNSANSMESTDQCPGTYYSRWLLYCIDCVNTAWPWQNETSRGRKMNNENNEKEYLLVVPILLSHKERPLKT